MFSVVVERMRIRVTRDVEQHVDPAFRPWMP
jgi:hypothetical protein